MRILGVAQIGHCPVFPARTAPDKTAIERPLFSRAGQIAATDRQIDALVYELHGLTEEEIRIVEGAEK